MFSQFLSCFVLKIQKYYVINKLIIVKTTKTTVLKWVNALTIYKPAVLIFINNFCEVEYILFIDNKVSRYFIDINGDIAYFKCNNYKA